MSPVVIDLESLVKTANLALRDLDSRIRQSIADEVGQRLARKVMQWKDRNLIWKAARNEAFSLFRERKWEVPATLLGDEESDDFIDRVPSPRRAGTDEPAVPLCVIEARLEAAYGNGNKHPHQAIIHAYYFLLRYSQTEIVSELAEQSLQQLAESLVAAYSRSSIIPRPALDPLFRDLLRVKGTKDGEKLLGSYWSPNATVNNWPTLVGDCIRNLEIVKGKPTFTLDAAIGKLPAYARLVYVFQEFAGVAPEEMVRGYAGETLDSLVVCFHKTAAERYSVAEAEVREWFVPLLRLNDTEGKHPLRKYFSPQHSISLWIQAVDRKLTLELQRQEARGLEIIFAQAEPWKTISFTYTALLKWSANDIAAKAGKPLRGVESGTSLMNDLELDYQADWGKTAGRNAGRPKATVSLEIVREWLKPLRTKLRSLRDSTTLASCATAEFGSAQDVALAISLWRGEILRMVTPLFSNGKQVPLFGWRHGLISEIAERRDE